MEDKRTEAEKCNGWLRKMGAFVYCVFECNGDFPNDYAWMVLNGEINESIYR